MHARARFGLALGDRHPQRSNPIPTTTVIRRLVAIFSLAELRVGRSTVRSRKRCTSSDLDPSSTTSPTISTRALSVPVVATHRRADGACPRCGLLERAAHVDYSRPPIAPASPSRQGHSQRWQPSRSSPLFTLSSAGSPVTLAQRSAAQPRTACRSANPLNSRPLLHRPHRPRCCLRRRHAAAEPMPEVRSAADPRSVRAVHPRQSGAGDRRGRAAGANTFPTCCLSSTSPTRRPHWRQAQLLPDLRYRTSRPRAEPRFRRPAVS